MSRSDDVVGHTAGPPPRLTVLAARDADVAVVLRRGPTDWVRLHRWDTATDTVEDGGWLRARVSGRRDRDPCVAPDVGRPSVRGDERDEQPAVGRDLLPLDGDATIDVDRTGRAVVCRAGRLEVHAGNGGVEVVADLAGQRPDPSPAPPLGEYVAVTAAAAGRDDGMTRDGRPGGRRQGRRRTP